MGRRGLRVCASAMVLVSALSACGGGGGGGDGSATPNNPQVPNLPSLIPTAPAPGATLVADATTLRPLTNGGVWSYSGVESVTGASVPDVAYSNTVTQAVEVQGTAMRETASNALNAGGGVQTVSHSGGEVRTLTAFDFGTGQLFTVNQLELRSPVRVDDQYTVLDQTGVSVGGDVDGDGRNDIFDAAIYSRVIGEETLDLPNWPQALAVRVRTTVSIRIRGSAGQSAVETATLDTWYAAGVGPIRFLSNVPGFATGTRVVDTETLTTFDGIDHGVGFLATQPAMTNVRLRQLRGVVTFDTHALMLSSAEFSSETVLSKISPRGTVLTAPHTGHDLATAQLVRLDAVARVLDIEPGGAVRMWPVNNEGGYAGPPTVINSVVPLVPGSGERFAAAATAAGIWLAWIDATPPFQPNVRVQLFDGNGQLVDAPKSLLTLNAATQVSNLRATASSTQALLTFNIGGGDWYAVMHGATPPANAMNLNGANTLDMFPGATTAGPNIVWMTNHGGAGFRLGGLMLGANDEPLRSTAGTFEEELIATPWVTNPDNYVRTAGRSSAQQDVYLRQGATSYVIELTPGGGPLATNNRARLLAQGSFPAASQLASLPNSVLLFTDEPAGISITPVWRRP